MIRRSEGADPVIHDSSDKFQQGYRCIVMILTSVSESEVEVETETETETETEE